MDISSSYELRTRRLKRLNIMFFHEESNGFGLRRSEGRRTGVAVRNCGSRLDMLLSTRCSKVYQTPYLIHSMPYGP